MNSRTATDVKLPNAPITEAVLEIIVTLPEAPDREAILRALEQEFREFGHRREQVSLVVEAGTQGVQASRAIQGLLLESEESRIIVHARLDGFAVSKLKPYSCWADFRLEAQGLWERYRRVTRAVRCVRLGLRYVNHIEIELAGQLTDVLTLFMSVPRPVAPAGLTEMTTVFGAEFPEAGAAARVVLHLPPVQTDDTRVMAMLDIDVFRLVDVGSDDEVIWSYFDRLRDVKNQIFFNSVTAQAMRRYEG